MYSGEGHFIDHGHHHGRIRSEYAVSITCMPYCIQQLHYYQSIIIIRVICLVQYLLYYSGYMLAFGDLAWVPFIYSLQTRYLVRIYLNLLEMFYDLIRT